jgi:aminoglycoside phosphotransferase family enzyme/predicted kinase
MQANPADHHTSLIRGLLQPQAWPAGIGEIEHIETHISSVLLAGEFAYKIKKPVDLGFLDFSTLQRRRHFCEEELRLNGRLAPQIYLEVVPITGTLDRPRLGGGGEAIDYAVKMRRFAADALLSIHPELLSLELITEIAERVAAFHDAIAVSGRSAEFGSAAAVLAPMEENFIQIEALLDDARERGRLERLRAWTRQRHRDLGETLEARRAQGFIRECHGDMHLGNIALDGDEILIFDGIEFNPGLRWIDVMSEIAFLFMDLEERGRSDLAWHFLNSYLQATGDFAGLALLRLYLVYRAMVRAKVAVIRLAQSGLSTEEKAAAMADYRAYVAQAEGYTGTPQPALLITHGLSGSGKSTATTPLLGGLGAIRIRSDVERKRLAGLGPGVRTGTAVGQGIYTAAASDQTYGRLLGLAEVILGAGCRVIVDATFLQGARRQPFQALAERLGVPFLILDFQVPEAILRQRVGQRLAAGVDPSEANLEVLERQLTGQEVLTEAEQALAITITPDRPLVVNELVVRLTKQR